MAAEKVKVSELPGQDNREHVRRTLFGGGMGARGYKQADTLYPVWRRRVCLWNMRHAAYARDAFTANMMKSNISILFDDMTPEQATGNVGKAGMPLDSLKLLVEVQQSSTLPARFKDFCFAANVPRVFTTNAVSPNCFHSGLPVDPWHISNRARCALGSKIKAVFKRT